MEAQLFESGTIPEHTTPEWYADRERAPHVDEWVHQGRLKLAAELVDLGRRSYGLSTVSDMGCGDGGLLTMINQPCWGYDLQPSNVTAGVTERGVDVRLGSALDRGVEWGELTVCTEVLEHLVDPHTFVRSIPSRAIVASSPFTETVESHYAFHTWVWDLAGYRALLQHGDFKIVEHETTGIFQVALGVRL